MSDDPEMHDESVVRSEYAPSKPVSDEAPAAEKDVRDGETDGGQSFEDRRSILEHAAARNGMQVQKRGDDSAVQAVRDAAAPERPSHRPLTGGLAIPQHVPPSAEILHQRLAPDVGAHEPRPVQITSPIIGGVEGNIPMPDTSDLRGLPWAQMGVSDSFLVGHGVVGEELEAAAHEWADEHMPGAKFKAHDMGNGVRIWRIV